MRTASVLSFDGSGYLFTEQFGTVTDFASQAIFQTIMIFMRPNDMGRGLVMYAYQTQVLSGDGHMTCMMWSCDLRRACPWRCP